MAVKEKAKRSIITMPDASTRYAAQPNDEVVESVIDELEALIVERGKQAREYTIKVFWEAGEMIRTAEKQHKVNISKLIDRVSSDNRIAGRQMGARNMWMAVKIFDSYPVFEKVYHTEHGENISLTKLKKELTTPKPKKEPTIEEVAQSLYNRFGPEDTRHLIKALQKVVDANTN